MEDWAFWYMGCLYLSHRLGHGIPEVNLKDSSSKDLQNLALSLERELRESTDESILH